MSLQAVSNSPSSLIPVSNVAPPAAEVRQEHTNPAGSIAEKTERIFNARADVRNQIHTIKKIKTAVAAALVLIGLAAMITACVFPATIPIGAVLALSIGGAALAFTGFAVDSFYSPFFRVKPEEEKKFWHDFSQPLSELVKNRTNWYCLGAPYYGQVSGFSGIRYSDLVKNEILTVEAAKTLEFILNESVFAQKEHLEASHNLLRLREMRVISGGEEYKQLLLRNENEYLVRRKALEKQFEEFRTQFIEERLKKYSA